MSTFFEMNCGGEAVTLEKTDDDDVIFHGYDEETELASIELGFEPSACWSVWEAINNDKLDTELIHHADQGNALLVKALIFVGASTQAKGHAGWAPLHWAAIDGHTDVVKILLEAGASVDAKDDADWTPLHQAVAYGHVDIVNILLEAGASVDVKDNFKSAPLHVAAWFGYTDVTEVLLDAGANVSAKNKVGDMPVHVAYRNNHRRVAKILRLWRIREHGE